MQLTTLDPGDSFVLDGNVRSKAGNVDQLQKSIERLGVLVPIIVRPEGSKWRVLAGQRRVLAATAAGAAIPAVIVDGLDTDLEALEAALAENLAREPLSEADEARGYEQLAAFGLDVAAISDVLSSTPARVKAGLAVAASKEALKRAERNQLTLEQAAVVAEFDGVKGATTKLMETIRWRPQDLAHTAAQLRQDVRDDKKMADLTAKFTAQGVPILKTFPSTWAPPSLTGTARLDKLAGKDGKNLTGANHRKCPGHAVALTRSWDGVEQVYVCTDPKGNGHRARKGETPRRDAAKPAEDRAEVIAGNKQWRAAEGVRREFAAGLLARKTVPAGTLGLLAWVMVDSYVNTHGGFMSEMFAKVPDPGLAFDDWATPTDREAPMLMLRCVASAFESTMTDVGTWRKKGLAAEPAARWLRFLESAGYTLADVEQRLAVAGLKQ